jgi:phospholipase/carboxylesterase
MHSVTDHDISSPLPAGEPAWIAPAGAPRAAVMLLHGLDMSRARLVPILQALKLPALLALPAGPVERAPGQRAWWPVDDAARAARLRTGPADLHDSHPPGRAAARDVVHATARALRARAPGLPLIVAGFSQGAMLALDGVLQDPPLAVDALSLWSASRLAAREWDPAMHRLQGIRIDLVHGRTDANIDIAAAEALRDALVAAQARVRWSPFDGGHEIPLRAWVGLRRLVLEVGRPEQGLSAANPDRRGRHS